jgi:N-glycosylase/DNA lyase
MREFKDLGRRGNEEWFSELCFCILTANSTARLGMKIQRELGSEGFLTLPLVELRHRLKAMGHRFPNTRARFIVKARGFRNIKSIIERFMDTGRAREWLAENVKGVGYKESSHFLRNVGFDDVAILDRHVLSVLHEYGLIDEVPSSLTRGRYLKIEKKLKGLARKFGLSLGELDLYLWYLKTGEVLK